MDKENNANCYVHISPGAKLDFVDDLRNKHDSERKEDAIFQQQQLGYQKSLRRWTIATTLIVMVYAGLTALLAKSASDANSINRDALYSLQRAFVTFKKMDGIRQVRPGKGGAEHYWTFYGEYENSGSTPARRATNGFFCGISNGAEPSSRDFIERAQVGQAMMTLGPKASQLVGPTYQEEADVFGSDLGDLTKQPKNMMVQNGRLLLDTKHTNLYCWGYLAYRDVFAETPAHLTEFCQKFIGFEYHPSEKSYTLNFTTCERHNCTDEDCAEYKDIAEKLAP